MFSQTTLIYHRSRVIRLEKDVYVLDDRVTGLGLNERDFRLFFNFAPGELTGAGMDWRYQTPKGRVYGFHTLSDMPVTALRLEGSENPIGGWVSYGYSLRVPAPQLRFRCKGPAPFRRIVVIAPEGCQVSGEVGQDQATLRLTGLRHITLTLKGDDEIHRD